MEREEIIRNIDYIKEIVESSNRYTNLSGLAGIFCGLLALVGCAASYFLLGSFSLTPDLIQAKLSALGILWLIVFTGALSVQIGLTIRKAHITGIQPWTKLSRQIIFALLPSLLAGAILTIYLFKYNQSIFIPGVWILLYGVGIAASGMFSILAVRLLGWAFIITSLIPLFVRPEYGLIFMALTFGLYHIIYGLAVAIKYRG
ncbi:MAG TPA: hypothetical protein VJC37_01325 [Planctomycetota bacterium]|nr:hypothetical protein [Planctomycetota bacterium]